MKDWKKSKKAFFTYLTLALLCIAPFNASAAENRSLQRVGVLNFKECVEKSKLGKQEQSTFESLKKQAEQIMIQREKDIGEVAAKLNDADYLESLSREAEAELRHKYKTISQEIAQQQQQLYQTLTQANYKILQKLTDEANKAAKVVAQRENLDMVFNDESTYFFANRLDITNLIINEMDASLSNEQP